MLVTELEVVDGDIKCDGHEDVIAIVVIAGGAVTKGEGVDILLTLLPVNCNRDVDGSIV